MSTLSQPHISQIADRKCNERGAVEGVELGPKSQFGQRNICYCCFAQIISNKM